MQGLVVVSFDGMIALNMFKWARRLLGWPPMFAGFMSEPIRSYNSRPVFIVPGIMD
jgi:hypothetical protein